MQVSNYLPKRFTKLAIEADEGDIPLPVVRASGAGLSAVQFALLMWGRVMEEHEEDDEAMPAAFINAIRSYRDLEMWAMVKSGTSMLQKDQKPFEHLCGIEVSEDLSVRLRWEHADGLQFIEISVACDFQVAVEWDGDPLNGPDLLEIFEADPRFSIQVD